MRETRHGDNFHLCKNIDKWRVFEAFHHVHHVGFIDEWHKVNDELLLRLDGQKVGVNRGILNIRGFRHG